MIRAKAAEMASSSCIVLLIFLVCQMIVNYTYNQLH